MKIILIAVFVIVVAGGGYMFWTTRTHNAAGALLGVALATEQAPITPPPTIPGATQTPGTFPTEQARLEATLKAFQQVVTSTVRQARG